MINTGLVFVVALAYLTSGGILIWESVYKHQQSHQHTKISILILAAALLAHGWVLYTGMQHTGINLALTQAFSLVAWVIGVSYLLISISMPIKNLGIVILPVAAILLVVAWYWPGKPLLRPSASNLELSHITVAILAYSLLCLAAIQSLLVSLQEYLLKHKHPNHLMGILPPLETNEKLLFQLLTAGFLLLTFTLLSGIFFSDEIFGKPINFTHHVVLSVCAWLVFGTILVRRWFFGWRGRNTIRWILAGFILIVLAYFGSKFVFEVIRSKT